MLITISGESASGKTYIKDLLMKENNCKGIVTYTTRQMRMGEKDHIDYHFIDVNTFTDMIKNEGFCEHEVYPPVDMFSAPRYYGTGLKDVKGALLSDDLYVIVLTPRGVRNIKSFMEKENIPADNLKSILVTAPLQIRIVRSIERLGDKFTLNDLTEISRRENADSSKFAYSDIYDLVIDNTDTSKEAVSTNISKIMSLVNEDKDWEH